MQMTDLLLRWQNNISPLILHPHLEHGYGDIRMKRPVPGN